MPPPIGNNVIIIVIHSNRLIDTKYPHAVHPVQLGHHTNSPYHDVNSTQHLVIITKLTSGVAKQRRDHKQRGLLILSRGVGVANDLFPRRHPVHLALLVEVRTALDPVQVHHGNEAVGDVAYRPAPLPRHEAQYGRLEDEDDEEVGKEQDGGGRIDPVGVAVARQLEGEEITARAAGAVKAGIGPGYFGGVGVDPGTVLPGRRTERGDAGCVGSLRVGGI